MRMSLRMAGAACLLGLVLTACESGSSPLDPTSPRRVGPEAAVDLDIPLLVTTNAGLALRNMDEGIVALEAKLERRVTTIEDRRALVSLYLARFRILGVLNDLDRAQALSVVESSAPDARLMKARVLMTRHHFAEAEMLLNQMGQSNVARDELLATAFLATGRASEAQVLLDQLPTSFSVVFIQAGALAELGAFEEADARYVDALKMYRDVSPFPVAEVYFRRGVMWAEMAERPELGAAMYAEGLKVLKSHVTMSIHAAELIAEAGRVDEAINLLEALTQSTDEPELDAVLGELYTLVATDPADPRVELAQASIRAAAEEYDRRLNLYREAYLDHGSEFWAGPGEDPSRALLMALENLALRPHQRAFSLALDAAEQAGDEQVLCQLVQRLQDYPVTHPSLELRRAQWVSLCL